MQQSSLLRLPGSPSSSAGPGGDKVGENGLIDVIGGGGVGDVGVLKLLHVWKHQCWAMYFKCAGGGWEAPTVKHKVMKTHLVTGC